MKARVFRTGAVLAALAVIGAAAAVSGQVVHKAPPAPTQQTSIVHYVGAINTTSGGKPVIRLTVAPAGKSGAPFVLPIKPRTNNVTKALEFDPKTVDLLKTLKKGDLLEVTYQRGTSENQFIRMDRYHLQPGEEDPDAWVFVKVEEETAGRETITVVTVRKLDQRARIIVPVRRTEDGRMAADDALVLKLAGIKMGELVEVDARTAGGKAYLEGIWRFSPPVRGEFIKLIEEPGDPPTPMGLQISTGGETQTFLLPVVQRGDKKIPDPRLATAAAGLKAGDEVEVKTRSAGGQEVAARITRLKAAPQTQPVTASRPATM